MQNHSEAVRSSIETAVGTGLFLTPWWAQLLTDVSLVASVTAQVTGAVIGLYGVYRLVKGFLEKKRE